MFLHILSVKSLENYRLSLQFSDGREGVSDLAESLQEGVFAALRDRAVFQQVQLNEELGTV